jgi:hypothetical protein
MRDTRVINFFHHVHKLFVTHVITLVGCREPQTIKHTFATKLFAGVRPANPRRLHPELDQSPFISISPCIHIYFEKYLNFYFKFEYFLYVLLDT